MNFGIYVNFWMGHKTNYKAPYIPASDVHYFSREDVEFQRKLYSEKALPHLRLETATPTETEAVIRQLQMELNKMKKRYETMTQQYELLSKKLSVDYSNYSVDPEFMEEIRKMVEKEVKKENGR